MDSDQASLASPSHLTLVCAHCGGIAAEFTLLPVGSPVAGRFLGEAMAHKDRLRRQGFLGTVTWAWSPESMKRLFDALARGDFRAAADVDDDAVGFYCYRCDAVYCERCWEIGPPVFDEDLPGFYDCTYGTCPRGHRCIVDD